MARKILKATAIIIPLIITALVICQLFNNSIITNQLLSNFSENENKVVGKELSALLQDKINNNESLSAIMAIIGVAVSVWIGLNIYNVADKKEIDKATEQANKLGKELRDLKGKTEQVYNAIMAETFSKTSSDYPPSLYFSKALDRFKGRIGNNVVVKIIEIEKLFSSTQEAFTASNVYARLHYAAQGVYECNKLEKILSDSSIKKASDEYNILQGYYHLRLADFQFNRGYRQADGERYLIDAIINYRKSVTLLFDCNANDAADIQRRIETLSDEHVSLCCFAYIMNVMGECNNVMMQSEMLPYVKKQNNYKESATFYCGFAYKITRMLSNEKDRPPHFAIYIRNYGTTLERFDDNSGNKADEIYLQAIKWKNTDYLSYQTYCSYILRKYLKDVFHADRRLGMEYENVISRNKAGECDYCDALRAIRSNILPKISILQKGKPESRRAFEIEITARSILCAVEGTPESETQVHREYIRCAKGALEALKN